MSEIACNVASVGYPPVQYSALDKQNLEKLRAMRDEAPFGRVRTGAPRSEIAYRVLVSNQRKRLVAPDFRWPFWTGLGLGAAAMGLLIVKGR